jgi:hypothetical protein
MKCELRNKVFRMQMDIGEIFFESSMSNLGCILAEQLSYGAIIELVKSLADEAKEADEVTRSLYEYFSEEVKKL